MIQPPAYVRYNSVVTAQQWQQLVAFISYQFWARPTSIVTNVISYSSSRTFTASTVPSIGGEPSMFTDNDHAYVGLPVGRNNESSTVSFGVNARISITYDNSFFLYPKLEASEPLTPLGNATAYCIQARTAASVTRFSGRSL